MPQYRGGAPCCLAAATLPHRSQYPDQPRLCWSVCVHRIRHYGLFAGSNRAETIATARKLLNLTPPAADASAKAQQTSETDPVQPLAYPCPCCGGRMFIIETFEPGCQPRYRPTAPPKAIRIDTS